MKMQVLRLADQPRTSLSLRWPGDPLCQFSKMLDGKTMDFAGPNVGFSLPAPRDYRGRVGAAIPSGGIVLRAARGGTAPITHTISNLPVGLAFNTTTRTITAIRSPFMQRAR